MITREEVRKAAALSKLELSEEEIEKHREELDAVLRYAEQLCELETEGVEPFCPIARQVGALRKDEVKPSMCREKALMSAEDVDAGYFRVPRIIE